MKSIVPVKPLRANHLVNSQNSKTTHAEFSPCLSKASTTKPTDSKISFRQALDAILSLGPRYHFSGMELRLLLHFITALGEEGFLDLDAWENTDRHDYAEKLDCTNSAYVSRLFGKLEEKSVLVSTKKDQKPYRSLHPSFAEAMLARA